MPALVLGLVLAGAAWAHQDPPGCSGTGVDFSFMAFRADGSPIDTSQTVTECETITYKITVGKSNIGTPCAFEGGTMTITTPDGVAHDVTPGGGVPCIGGTVAGGCATTSSMSNTVNYTVSPVDVVAGQVTANGQYHAAFSHTGGGHSLNTPNANSNFPLTVEFCPTSTDCVDNFCDPNLFDSTTGALGNCVSSNVPDSTPCTDIDGNLCTFAGCDGAGNCDQSHTVTVCPPDGNECTFDAGCNPVSGLCEYPPVPDSVPCTDTDGNQCTTAGCNGAGGCDQNHQVTVCPPDGNECTTDLPCDSATGACVYAPVPDSTPCTDTDGQACSVAGCNAAAMCDQLHIDNCPHEVNHYQCYETKRVKATFGTHTLVDRFGNHGPILVNRQERLCPPADKNDENPTAVTDPDHLAIYKINGFAANALNQTITDQFGNHQLDITKVAGLMVPSSKSLTSPPPPLNPVVADHYTCYKVRKTRGTASFVPQVVKVDDQLESLNETLKRPFRLCTPVSKDGGLVLNPTRDLLCYKIPRIFFGTLNTFQNNQFGQSVPLLIKRVEFCVPTLEPGATTTTSTSTSTTSTTSSSTSSSTSTSTSTSTSSTTSTTLVETLCCEVPTGSPTLPTLCFDAISPDVDVKCQLLGGILVPGVCDPVSERCVPPQPVQPNDWCCECPVPAPPFPHPQFCFEGVIGHEQKCQPPCILIPGLACGPHSEQCGGSPSGAFLDPADATF